MEMEATAPFYKKNVMSSSEEFVYVSTIFLQAEFFGVVIPQPEFHILER